MNKEFINYEQALALKELGFDEPCFGYYQQEWHDDGMTELEPSLQMIISKQHQHAHQICTAPTFSQAFRFFRKKYKLGHSICPYSLNAHIIELEPIDDEPKEYTVYISNFYTYENTELECLKKLIEIVKNK
jgi:hypothetical protein